MVNGKIIIHMKYNKTYKYILEKIKFLLILFVSFILVLGRIRFFYISFNEILLM
ncbi:hypothetical protein [Clostridium perfringens str. 13]|uniref:Uncharacterized protein n=1 Tax=Clostridium perfringens (strain 13 / Type A) TaxID=195102 RepID=Q8XJ40_CLOPE|nr:hypothetical protein [Clostridium perfringens str. 13]